MTALDSIRTARAYQSLLNTPSAAAAWRRVERIEQGEVRIKGKDIVIGDGHGVDWTDNGLLGRSFQRVLHGHIFLRDLAVVASAGNEYAADLAFRIIGSWRKQNPRSNPADSMAWHDETTALRLLSWLHLYSALHERTRHREDLVALKPHCTAHASLLMDPEFHSAGTNHGMFQDHALIAWAASPASEGVDLAEDAYRVGKDRLVAYLEDVVSSDGVHLEHSPAYHEAIANSMSQYVDFFEKATDLSTAERIRSLRASMRPYAVHVLQPNGRFPLVGDTFASDKPNPELFAEDDYRFACTAGEDGSAPEASTAFFPAAGYAIIRSSWADGRAGTYIHFSAAYHRSYHKHADDLSVWIYHRGELLTESGPNGYEYDDPFTRFAFGAASHNVVLVNGRGVPRADGHTDSVAMVDHNDSGSSSVALGETSRFEDAVHRRQVTLHRLDRTIEIVDELEASVESEYCLLWHAAPGIDVREDTGLYKLSRDNDSLATLSVNCNDSRGLAGEVLYGDPELRGGWRLGGDEPRAVPTLRFICKKATYARFLTTISLLDGVQSG